MFDNLTNRLGEIFSGLKKRGALSEDDVDTALRQVRVALLEADVAVPVVKDLVAAIREEAVGHKVLRSVTPGQMVVKIVHDHLVRVLGGDPAAPQAPAAASGAIDLVGVPPVAILMVGLQGSGKTTTSAKLALKLKRRDKKKVLMASLDVRRPAAQRQLVLLGEQADVPTLSVILGEQPLAIAKRAMRTARQEGSDVLILDTAGRLHIDSELMAEAATIVEAVQPTETLLVADALTGQDAAKLATEFNDKIGITGIVLTRVDGDARGGAALSMRAVSGQPIKLMGTGEKLDALEDFDAGRVAGRILGQGDVVGLVEKAAEIIDSEEAEEMTAKMVKGKFTMDDMGKQLKQLRKMGDVKGLLGMLPGVGKIKKQLAAANVDDGAIARQEAIILSMTAKERSNPKVLNGSRRRRIASGSGTSVQEVNRLLKSYKQMTMMMKKMGRTNAKGLTGGGIPPPGMMPPLPPMR
ncbi:MAG TPA: signal recognition particle protein [Rhodospirillales bacterium]|nr:signal recognition particle protein [Rhodospirillales bacterium]